MRYINQLPEKWKIKVTEENIKALGKWRDSGSIDRSHIDKLWVVSMYNQAKGWGSKDAILLEKFKEITFEEFKVHILGEKLKEVIYEIY